jgi:transcription elongation factor GreA
MFQQADPRITSPSGGRFSRARGLPLTPQAHERLQLEFERLRAERHEHADRLRSARAFGEEGANDEVMALREEEAVIEARLVRLEEILSRAQVIEESGDGDAVAIGNQVTLLDQQSGRTETYRIDGAHGSLDSNVISALSPMGAALIGRDRGAVVDVELPSGRVRTFTVLEVERQPYG